MIIYLHGFTDIERALRLLETYNNKLSNTNDAVLRTAIEKVIRLFRSKLFFALIGKYLWVFDTH